MNSLSWKSPKNNVKGRQEFTPNIYRKPSVDSDEPKQNVQSDDSSPELHIAKSKPLSYKSVDIVSEQMREKYNASSGEHVEQGSHFTQMKARYDQEFAEYQKKQDDLDVLKKEISEREEQLNKKCSILKSTIVKVEEKIPEVEIAKLNDKRDEFEKEKASLEQQLLQLKSAQKEYADQAKKLENNRAQLALDISSYEGELESLENRKTDLEEKTRSLEEQLSSGDELSLDLDGVEYSAALGLIKSSYYSEMKEINRKRADLETLKLETENEEAALLNRISAIDKIKKQAKKDFLELKPKIQKLDEMSSDYQSRLEEYERNQKELLESVSKHELEYSSLKKKHSEELDKLSQLKNECLREEKLLKEKMENILKSKESAQQKEDSISLKTKQLETKNKELEFEIAQVGSKQKENLRLKENLDHAKNELEHKREELDSLRETINEDINTHVIIRRQRLDIKKASKRQEQQSAYIKSLEDNVRELREQLEKARSEVKTNEVFTSILNMNLELSK